MRKKFTFFNVPQGQKSTVASPCAVGKKKREKRKNFKLLIIYYDFKLNECVFIVHTQVYLDALHHKT